MNEELREMNRDLKQNNDQLKEKNEILSEENSVNRELIIRFYADFDKALPADLVNRLANIDARRQPVTASSHAGTNMEDMQSNGNEMNSDEDDDYIIDDEDGCDDDDDLDDTDEDDSNGNNGGCEEVDDH